MSAARQAWEEGVLAALEAAWASYEAATPKFFDCFTPGASFFVPAHPTRLAGRSAYQRFAAPYLGESRCAVHVLHPEVRRLGAGTALVTHHARIRANYNALDYRVTALLEKRPRGWLLAHLHMSPLARADLAAAAGRRELITRVPAKG